MDKRRFDCMSFGLAVTGFLGSGNGGFPILFLILAVVNQVNRRSIQESGMPFLRGNNYNLNTITRNLIGTR